MYLNCHTCFSLRYGTMSTEELLVEARNRNIKRLALTDINNTSACMDFIRLAPKYGITPLVGVDFRNGAEQMYVALARNNKGFREINQLLTRYLASGTPIRKRAPRLNNCYIIYPFKGFEAHSLRENEFIGVNTSEVNQLHFSHWRLSQEKLVVLQPVTFRHKQDFNAHRLLRAIDNNTLLSKLPESEQATETERFPTPADMDTAFLEFPQIVANTNELLGNMSIAFEFGTNKNKATFTGDAAKDVKLLRRLALRGLKERYGNPPSKEAKERFEHELKIINELGFTSYFLINHDIVSYAMRKKYFYTGRGSGANSLIAFCLRITNVDPIELDLYFERFINPFRANPPDFDLDFSWRNRDDVIKYIFSKHGMEHTVLLATYSTFQQRAVVRELGKVFGLPKGEVDELLANRRQAVTAPDSIVELILRYSRLIDGMPNYLSVHAGGILISEKPIASYTGTYLPPKGFPTTQFSMLEAEDIGLYKFDILSQRGLGHIADAIELIRKNQGIDLSDNIHNPTLLKRDEKVKELLRTGRTMGCFYVESPAMRMLLTKLKADTYKGLVAASSIIRPGVARSGMMKEYIYRFRDPRRIKHVHPRIGEILEETYGVMVYQEDVLKVAHEFAGLSLGEADVLRRGMSGKFRSREEFAKVEQKFFDNCRKRGYTDATSREVWRQIESFAGYSFSKGHSASYAVESYQSLYLKAYYPLEFMVAVINNFGGFYRTEFYMHEARMMGANIQAPCINQSDYYTNIKGDVVHFGFIHVNDLEKYTIEQLLDERNANGPFKSLVDVTERVVITLDQLCILIQVGGFRFTEKTKRELLWEAHMLLGNARKSKPKADLFDTPPREFNIPQLEGDQHQDAFDEWELLGFTISNPFDLLQEQPQSEVLAQEVTSCVGKTVTMVGYMVTAKYTSTVNGLTMSFGTWLDRDGFFFDTVHFPPSLERYPFRGRGIYRIEGRITEEFDVYAMEVTRMEKLPFLQDPRYDDK